MYYIGCDLEDLKWPISFHLNFIWVLDSLDGPVALSKNVHKNTYTVLVCPITLKCIPRNYIDNNWIPALDLDGTSRPSLFPLLPVYSPYCQFTKYFKMCPKMEKKTVLCVHVKFNLLPQQVVTGITLCMKSSDKSSYVDGVLHIS